MIAPGTRVGKYEITRLLGQGGFGMVYVARDTKLDRDCALKFLLPEHTTRLEILQRFLAEARSAAKIKHGGIVTVYECDVVAGAGPGLDGMAYIAMELLEGQSLHERLARGRLPIAHAVEIARQVASALAAAHAEHIVHRDLKPDNIFLVPDAATVLGERVKVLDFGIAKLADDTGASAAKTSTHMIFGTPRYMSPEQCKSTAKVDERSDIYALGCILFEMITGKPPFEGDAGELIAMHQLAPAPSARAARPELPPELEATIAAMLAKKPAERPPTMTEVARRLGARSVTPLPVSAGGGSEVAPTLAPDAPTHAPAAATPAPIEPTPEAVGAAQPPTPAPTPQPAPAPPARAGGELPPGIARVAPTTPVVRRRATWPLVAGALAIAGIVVGVVVVAAGGSGTASVAPSDAAVALADAAEPAPTAPLEGAAMIRKLVELRRRASALGARGDCGAPYEVLLDEARRASPLLGRELARGPCAPRPGAGPAPAPGPAEPIDLEANDPLESRLAQLRISKTPGPWLVRQLVIGWDGSSGDDRGHDRSKADADVLVRALRDVVQDGGDLLGLAEALSEGNIAELDLLIPRKAPPSPLVRLAQGLKISEVSLARSERGWHLVQRLAAPPALGELAPPVTASTTAGGVRYVRLRPSTNEARPTKDSLAKLELQVWSGSGDLLHVTQRDRGVGNLMVRHLPQGFREAVEVLSVGDRARFWIPKAMLLPGSASDAIAELELLAIAAPPAEVTYCIGGVGSSCKTSPEPGMPWHRHGYVTRGAECFECWDAEDEDCATETMGGYQGFRPIDEATCHRLGLARETPMARVVRGKPGL